MTVSTGLSHRRVIVVGGGHTGLAVAAALMGEGLRPQQDFVVIDAAEPGQRSWACRWHSMVLLSDARRSALPIRQLPGDPRRHPRVDEMVDYLKVVEAALGVETVWQVRATGVQRRGDGSTLHLSTSAGEVQTRNVVCATGANAHPRIPAWAETLTVPGVVMHSGRYLYPRQVPTADVLIVGGGNSGVQISRELAASHTVTLSVRTARRDRSLRSYATEAGEDELWISGTRRPEPVFGDSYEQLRRFGVRIVPAVTSAAEGTVTFEDRTQTSPGSVIFATGFDPGDDWFPEEARNRQQRRTITGMPGLFAAGFPQYSRRDAHIIAKASSDAVMVARHIINRP